MSDLSTSPDAALALSDRFDFLPVENAAEEVNHPPFMLLADTLVVFAPDGEPVSTALPAYDFEGDPFTYEITGGADAALFEIDAASGLLTLPGGVDYANPMDADGDNALELAVTLTDPFGSSTHVFSIQMKDPDPPPPPNPVIQPVATSFNIGGRASELLVSGLTVGKVTDVDALMETGEDLPITFQLFGQDAPFFEIDAVTGEISLPTVLSGRRGSFDGDSLYQVTVLAETEAGATDVLEIDYYLLTGA